MSDTSTGAVIVGIDGSAASMSALRWAAEDATLTGRPLHLLHAWQPPTPSRPTRHSVTDSTTPNTVMEDALSRARQLARQVPVTHERVEGPADAVLVAASQNARTLVIGAHGRRQQELTDVGSTGWQVVSRATCPVVVVREESIPDQPAVVVGVGGSHSSDAAVDFAFAQASRRRVPLVAVYGWRLERIRASFAVLQSDTEHHEEDVARRCQLEAWLRPWHKQFPEVPVRLVAKMWHPADLLLDEAGRGQLLVVGRRPLQEFPWLLLDSVGFDVLRQTPGPVAVVPNSG